MCVTSSPSKKRSLLTIHLWLFVYIVFECTLDAHPLVSHVLVILTKLDCLTREHAYFIKGSITVRLTSCLTGEDSAALLVVNQIKIYKFGQISTSQTGGQPYSDTSPYEVSECSLAWPSIAWLKKARLYSHKYDLLTGVETEWVYHDHKMFDRRSSLTCVDP